jgi:hypothetical protein
VLLKKIPSRTGMQGRFFIYLDDFLPVEAAEAALKRINIPVSMKTKGRVQRDFDL